MKEEIFLSEVTLPAQNTKQKLIKSKKCPLKASFKKATNDTEQDQLDIDLTQSASRDLGTLSPNEVKLVILETVKMMTGTSNTDLAGFFLNNTVCALPQTKDKADSHNVTMQGLYEMKTADATECMLCSQAIALYAQGMDNLKRARSAPTHEIAIIYTNLATKLLRLQQETIERLEKYRRKGQQTVRVEHLHIESGAQAIVGSVTTGEGLGLKT